VLGGIPDLRFACCGEGFMIIIDLRLGRFGLCLKAISDSSPVLAVPILLFRLPKSFLFDKKFLFLCRNMNFIKYQYELGYFSLKYTEYKLFFSYFSLKYSEYEPFSSYFSLKYTKYKLYSDYFGLRYTEYKSFSDYFGLKCTDKKNRGLRFQ
jgi:hypothetical protein